MSPTCEKPLKPKFAQPRTGEVCRIPVLRTPRVNKGIKKAGAHKEGPRAQRKPSWREASGGATLNIQNHGRGPRAADRGDHGHALGRAERFYKSYLED